MLLARLEVMRKEMNVLDTLNIAIHAITRKVKHITSIVGQTSKIAVEQQSNSTLAVAANMQRHLAQI
jgi:hypothetical protein